jgi:hypothetical protein
MNYHRTLYFSILKRQVVIALTDWTTCRQFTDLEWLSVSPFVGTKMGGTDVASIGSIRLHRFGRSYFRGRGRRNRARSSLTTGTMMHKQSASGSGLTKSRLGWSDQILYYWAMTNWMEILNPGLPECLSLILIHLWSSDKQIRELSSLLTQ